ncbi:hypothetical protein ACS0TY_027460 [Phlomoides rotata]
MDLRFLILVVAIYATTIAISPTSGQITTPCTPSMITTFTPCISFVTNSSGNGTSPTSDCCNSLSSLMSTGKDCLCLIATGSVPFRIPVNRTLAISLPRACNMPGVPLQCKAAGVPVPAPSPLPLENGPSLSPNAAPSPLATGAEPLSPRSAPRDGETPIPQPPTTTGGAPTGSRAGVTPSAAYTISPLHIMAVLGAIALNYF